MLQKHTAVKVKAVLFPAGELLPPTKTPWADAVQTLWQVQILCPCFQNMSSLMLISPLT